MAESCRICCIACRAHESGPQALIPTSQAHLDPYRISNLLPAGTITLSITGDASLCDHVHRDGGWHEFRADTVIPHLANADDETLCRHLEFLRQHKFLVARCQLGRLRSCLFVRVYLIPFDLAGVQGRLRVRDEAKVMRPARQSLRVVLPRIMQGWNDWLGEDLAPSSSLPKPFLKQDVDNRSLAELYSDLPSPHIDPPSDDPAGALVRSILAGEEIDGLRTRLYRYQRETVAAMIQKELRPSDIGDPLYIPLTGLDGTVFYFQPATMELLRDQPRVSQDRGGILCEELGTGKTVMMLALILATVDQLPAPEPSYSDVRPVMTPISLRSFHGPQVHSARKRMSRSAGDAGTTSGLAVPTLVESVLHFLRVHPDGLHLRRYEDSVELGNNWVPLELNTPFYYEHNDAAEVPSRSKRKSMNPGPRVVYLTPATLVVVPPNLLGQWSSEIQKHCDSTVRVLIVRPQQELPRARLLASRYDIVLLNHDSLAKEASKLDIDKLRSWNMCKCPPWQETRVPDCSCDIIPGVSPLLQLRWKRLVVDEGHVHGNDKSRISTVAHLLTVERRWLVSGTPTTNLLGLSFGSQSELADDSGSEPQYPSEHDLSTAPNPVPGQMSRSSSVDEHVARVWTVRDRDNLHRLKHMVVNFLRVPQFAAIPARFDTHVVQALFGPGGPQPGAIQVLGQVMQSVMIRHRIEDVERDIALPPLKHETVLLDLDSIAIKSYNALQAVIAINAIDSERVDQDYLFHPSNVARLQQLVENISQLMFWHVDDNLFNVEELFQAAAPMIDRAIERGVSPSDLKLLKDATRHIMKAATNSIWRWVQRHPFPDIPFCVKDMPTEIFRTWSEMPYVQDPDDAPIPAISAGLMFPSRIAKLREIVSMQPLITHEHLVARGVDFIEEEKLHLVLWKEQVEKARQRARSKHREEDQREVVKAVDTARRSEAPEKVAEPSRPTSAPPASDLLHSNESSQRRTFMLASPLAKVRIGDSASAKLDYLLSEVLRYSGTEKFLIFSKSPLTLAHVADGLNLARVKFLQYTTKVPLVQREQLVITFETSETYRVFLMELKHGSRGLNLVSASRVIFCEPVWQADVEAQAIKRVHRIGQTRPISVKTLAIRNTAEEVMMSRRAELKDKDPSQHQNLSMTDDFRMRTFIANPQFIEEGPPSRSAEAVSLDIPFLDIPPEAPPPPRAPAPPIAVEHDNHAAAAGLQGEGSSRLEGTFASPSKGVAFALSGLHVQDGESPSKKRRTVRFMDG